MKKIDQKILDEIQNEKPSETLRYAIKSLELAKRKKWIVINMSSTYHTYYGDNTIKACFAGIAILRRLGLNIIEIDKIYREKGSFPIVPEAMDYLFNTNSSILQDYENFLDMCRHGAAIYKNKIPPYTIEFREKVQVNVISYRESPSAFIKCMKELANNLEAAGY